MKQLPLIVSFLILVLPAVGQQKIDELVNAEKRFAALGKDVSTKLAFVSYLDSNSVVFRNGAIMNGFNTWNSRKEDSSLLLWGPEFAVISASGDFGITSGPSVYRTTRIKDSRSYFGHFASLWHKDQSGNWKVLCDIGISHDSINTIIKEVETVVLTAKPNAPLPGKAVLKQEQKLFVALNQNKVDELLRMLSDKARLLINGKLPIFGIDMQHKNIVTPLADLTYTNAGHWLSKANDMFISYGKTKKNDKEGNYMSAWILENNHWKIVLLVVA